MASLPEDVERWIAAHLRADDVNIARELLSNAIDHAGAALGSRGDLVQLRYLVGLLQIDYRDVIMCGEYDVVDGKLTHVRNLNEPLA
jgi:hypothetical protein